MSFNIEDYVDVAQRIQKFYERYPEGSLRTGSPPALFHVGERTFVAYHAQAFRNPDDQSPTDGWAWEPIPGPTSFTRDSELMNAETAAWGRAIVALGFETKKIASKDEVQARDNGEPPPPKPEGKPSAEKFTPMISVKQRDRMWAIASEHKVPNERVKEIILQVCGPIQSSNDIPRAQYDAVITLIQAEPKQ